MEEKRRRKQSRRRVKKDSFKGHLLDHVKLLFVRKYLILLIERLHSSK